MFSSTIQQDAFQKTDFVNSPQVGRGVYPVILNDLMERINRHSPAILLRHRLLEITDTGVLVEDMQTGGWKAIQADRVCLSLGSAPVGGLAERFQAAFDKVAVIGSAEKDGRIHDAISQGYIRGWEFV